MATKKIKKPKLNVIQLDKNTIVYTKKTEKEIREAFRTRRLNTGRLTAFYYDDYLNSKITA